MPLLTLIVLLLGVFSAQTCWGEPSSTDILKKICSGSCSGTMANVAVLADKNGTVKYYRFTGSLQSCSHPPSVIYDLKGKVVTSMSEHPVNPIDQVQTKTIKKWQSFLKDLTETKMMWCGDILK